MTTQIQHKIWFQGNEYWSAIYEASPDYCGRCTHAQLAEFSRAFTNYIGECALPGLVYLDSGCGFKVRGYFSHQNESALDWREFSTHQVKNGSFGTWFGFPFYKDNCFYFESCNGNALIAFADWQKYEETGEEVYHLEIVLSEDNAESCNYKEFLEKNGVKFSS